MFSLYKLKRVISTKPLQVFYVIFLIFIVSQEGTQILNSFI